VARKRHPAVSAVGAKQLEYHVARSLMKRYAPFSTVTRAALGVRLRPAWPGAHAERIDALMGEYLVLSMYPDVPNAIKQFACRKAILTNGSPNMIEPLVAQLRTEVRCRAQASTGLKIYKPAPEVYGLAVKN